MKRDRLLIIVAVLALATAFAASQGCSKDSGTNPPPGGGPTFASGDFTTGVFVFTFTTDGTFGYQCTNHQPGMDGVVVVSPAGQDSPMVLVGLGTLTAFDPDTVQVKTGSYVRWVYGGAGMAHNVTMP